MNTQTQFCAKSHHTQEFYKLIEDFFFCQNAASRIEHINELNYNFIYRAVNEEEGYTPEFIRDSIFNSNEISNFIAKLSDKWESYKRFNNLNPMQL